MHFEWKSDTFAYGFLEGNPLPVHSQHSEGHSLPIAPARQVVGGLFSPRSLMSTISSCFIIIIIFARSHTQVFGLSLFRRPGGYLLGSTFGGPMVDRRAQGLRGGGVILRILGVARRG